MSLAPPSTPISADQQQWLFTEEEMNTLPPSLKYLTPAQEAKERHATAGLIQELGIRLHMYMQRQRPSSTNHPSIHSSHSSPQLAIATAIVYMHRFYMRESFKTHSLQV